MNKRKMVKLEKEVPQRAVAALNAAHRRVVESKLPHVVVINDGLYRISASGEKQLIHKLPPRKKIVVRNKGKRRVRKGNHR